MRVRNKARAAGLRSPSGTDMSRICLPKLRAAMASTSKPSSPTWEGAAAALSDALRDAGLDACDGLRGGVVAVEERLAALQPVVRKVEQHRELGDAARQAIGLIDVLAKALPSCSTWHTGRSRMLFSTIMR